MAAYFPLPLGFGYTHIGIGSDSAGIEASVLSLVDDESGQGPSETINCKLKNWNLLIPYFSDFQLGILLLEVEVLLRKTLYNKHYNLVAYTSHLKILGV